MNLSTPTSTSVCRHSLNDDITRTIDVMIVTVEAQSLPYPHADARFRFHSPWFCFGTTRLNRKFARATTNSQQKGGRRRAARIQGPQFTAGRTPGAHGLGITTLPRIRKARGGNVQSPRRPRPFGFVRSFTKTQAAESPGQQLCRANLQPKTMSSSMSDRPESNTGLMRASARKSKKVLVLCTSSSGEVSRSKPTWRRKISRQIDRLEWRRVRLRCLSRLHRLASAVPEARL